MEKAFLCCRCTDLAANLFAEHPNQSSLHLKLLPSIKSSSAAAAAAARPIFLAQKSNPKPSARPPPPPSPATPTTNGDLQEAIAAVERGIPIESRTYISLLQSCIDSDSIGLGCRLHASIASVRDRDVFVDTKLVSMYAKCGSLDDARRVFDGMGQRNLFAWSAMIGAYVREHRWSEVLDLFFDMMREGVVIPDGYLLPRILQACSNTGNLEAGRLLHSLAVKTGLLNSSGASYLSNTVLSMYAKCGELEMATKFFEGMGKRDSVSWNSIITGHCQLSEHEVAMRLFARMRAEGIEPSPITWTILITGYHQTGKPELAMELMEQMKRSGTVPDVFTWTSMISGLTQNGRTDEALSFFHEMQFSGVNPNSMSVACALFACACLQALNKGKELHSYAFKLGGSHSILVGNSLIELYAKCDRLADAQKIFDGMLEKDVFSWNSMIGGYAQAGYCGKAYELFSRMESLGVHRNVVTWNIMISGFIQNEDEDQAMELFHMMEVDGIKRNTATWNTLIAGSLQNGDTKKAFRIFKLMQTLMVRHNSVTFLSILPACTNLLSELNVKEIHSCILHSNLQGDTAIANALIDAYSKSGNIENAWVVFNGLSSRDLITWNSMISALVVYGYSHEARDLFQQMKQEGINPNEAIFVSMINAYALDELVNEGKRLFSSMMEEYKLSPGLEHYTAMTNLLGRSGKLREACELIKNMPIEPNAAVWYALLTAARMYTDIKMANLAARHLFRLEPRNPEVQRLLSHAQDLYESPSIASKVCNLKKAIQIGDAHGCCWMEVNNQVMTFLNGGQILQTKLDEINSKVAPMKVATSFLDDIILEFEEEKEEIIGTHSEKLAITFGLDNLPAFRTIRIIKSVRMCSDCHITSKLISKTYKHEILIKDRYSFHHFKDGACSCRDYW
ncbi:pentatricopeptide repeat-containing protein At1g19720-like [Zingiber officinale]|uniref:DYW domain-containing protein n=1 Tax=Zingiber officinale TaxID=94328 RepID=A0A8J5EMS5_ZINOF|nr:pentatricopeptide repeat-containing protein At1g19720-like [Zingiber officinale]KAG6469213.1 hypothetical protein ZIOFF_073918 [Zingiber officinale]